MLQHFKQIAKKAKKLKEKWVDRIQHLFPWVRCNKINLIWHNGPDDVAHRKRKLEWVVLRVLESIHTHTHIYIYIYIYIYWRVLQVVIKASFIKDVRTLFFIFYCNFSSLLIFLVSGSMYKRNCPLYSAQELSTILLVVIRGSVVLVDSLSFYRFNYLLRFLLKFSVRIFSVFCFKIFGWKKKGLLIELVIFTY